MWREAQNEPPHPRHQAQRPHPPRERALAELPKLGRELGRQLGEGLRNEGCRNVTTRDHARGARRYFRREQVIGRPSSPAPAGEAALPASPRSERNRVRDLCERTHSTLADQLSKPSLRKVLGSKAPLGQKEFVGDLHHLVP